MDDLQSERERQLDRLWLHKEHTRREFLDSNLSEFGEAVFLNGCWVFRHKVPFTRGSDESELGLSRKALSEVGQLERLKLIDEAVERKNAAFQEEVSRRHIEIDEFFRELNTRWRRVMEAWLAEEGANTHLNPQLANTRRIVRVNDLLSHEGEKPKVIIKSLLSKTWIALLAGASKSNKSWLALQLAIAVSKGEEWLGFQCHPRRVLYIDYELSLHSLKGRLKKLGLSREVPNQGPDFLILKGGHYKNEVDRILKLIRSSQMPEYAESTEEDRQNNEGDADAGENKKLVDVRDIYDLIILDPLYMLLGDRDENSARDMVKVFHDIRKLQAATGAAILINTHFRKGIRDFRSSSADRISGSGVFARYPDVIMALERLDEGVSKKLKDKLKNRYRMDFTVRHLKAPDPRGLTLDEQTRRFSTTKDHELKEGRDLVQIAPARRGRRSKSDKLILEAMKRKARDLNGMSQSAAVPLIANDAKVGKSTVYRFLKNKKRYVFKRGNKLYVDLSYFEK